MTSRLVRVLLALLGFFVFSTSFAQTSFLCVADKSSGVYFNKNTKSWEGTHFKADTKYLVKRPEKPSPPSWIVTRIGSSAPLAWCKEDFNELGFLSCEGFYVFKMNKKNLRFLNAYLIGYVTDGLENEITGGEGSNTPNVEIGKCSPL